MSIEAMSKAYEALNKSRPFNADNARMQRDAMDALRTAIQQAESEPVGAREALERIASWSEHPAMLGVDYGSNGVRDYYRKIARDALTHPAQGVPEQDWERKERLQSIADTAAASGLFGLAQKWADNEIHSYQFTHRAAAIVLQAMLAASPAQNRGLR